MKLEQGDDINYVVGWLCGAVFVAGPVVALILLLRKRRRQAFQAIAIGVATLGVTIAVRAPTLYLGWPRSSSPWTSVDAAIFVICPLLVTGVMRSIPWPSSTFKKRRSKRHG